MADLREYFNAAIKANTEKGINITSLPTAWILNYLKAKEESPWGAYLNGSSITPRQLAGILKSFGIRSKDIRWRDVNGERVLKGYEFADFQDAFERYL